MRYYVVDAFTSEAFGGNPAGVVLLGKNGAFPDDELMRQVAAELRYSETAFVQQNGPTEFTVRYFTPAAEVDLCGHATIATFGVLRQEGIVPTGAVCMNHTLAGDLQVKIGPRVMMQMAPPRLVDQAVDVERLHHIMAGASQLQWPELPVEIISTGLPDIIMPMSTLFGASYIMWADAYARSVHGAAELPLGIVTAFIGAPFFMFLMIKNGYGGSGK